MIPVDFIQRILQVIRVDVRPFLIVFHQHAKCGVLAVANHKYEADVGNQHCQQSNIDDPTWMGIREDPGVARSGGQFGQIVLTKFVTETYG